MHHGVRISDDAIVAAGMLSDRYIADRFLPDKAIDLVDEAASRLKIEIDSMPNEIDVVQRRIVQLEIEQAAMEKETAQAAPSSGARRLAAEIANLREQLDGMMAEWQSEKDAIERGAQHEGRDRGDARRGRARPARWATCSGPPS